MDRHDSASEVAAIDKAMAGLGQTPVDFVITPQMQAWIDYNALSGVITDNLEEQTMRKMPITEFARLVGVNRDTLRNWRTYIPNFWERVHQRTRELAPQSRLQVMHERWYLEALKMKNWTLTEAWLRNFDKDYKEARQKHDHNLEGNFLDMIAAAASQGVIEGEVVHAEPQPQADTGRSGQNPGVLSGTS